MVLVYDDYASLRVIQLTWLASQFIRFRIGHTRDGLNGVQVSK